MNVLITGGAGFVGSNLALAFRQAGHDVCCFDNLSRRGSEVILARILAGGCRFAHGDIRNHEDFVRLKGDFDLLIECSAEPSVQVGQDARDALFMVNNNLFGTVVCLEYARSRNMPVIFLSTSRVYPYDRINALSFKEESSRFVYDDQEIGISDEGITQDFPLGGVRTLYGATKLASELILQEFSHNYGLPCIINRCGVIAGPWQMGKVDQGFVTFWIARHVFDRPLRYLGFGGRGKQVRDILHIDDLIDLVMKQSAMIGKFRGQIFHAGGGREGSVSLHEMTALCREATGRTLALDGVEETRAGDVIWYVTDNGNTGSTFDWRPKRPPARIVADTLAWILENKPMLAPLFQN